MSKHLPSPLVAAGGYMNYLWMGHCYHCPESYFESALAFHEDEVLAAANYEKFLAAQARGIGAVLLPRMVCIVKNARRELQIDYPIEQSKRRVLQVYLAGEVTEAGAMLAQDNGLYIDCPDLIDVTSPFADAQIIDHALRAQRSGRIAAAFTRYADIDKLLPGYQINDELSI